MARALVAEDSLKVRPPMPAPTTCKKRRGSLEKSFSNQSMSCVHSREVIQTVNFIGFSPSADMNQMGLHRPCSHHHPVQTFHGISDDKFISPKARMNINFVSQGLRRTAEPDSQAREQVEPRHMSRRPSTRSRLRDQAARRCPIPKHVNGLNQI